MSVSPFYKVMLSTISDKIKEGSIIGDVLTYVTNSYHACIRFSISITILINQ